MRTGVTLVAADRRDEHHGDVVTTLDDGSELRSDEILSRRSPAHRASLGLGTSASTRDDIEVDIELRAPTTVGRLTVHDGDCNGQALFTPHGQVQGRVAGNVILGKTHSNEHHDPRVTFTDPQVPAQWAHRTYQAGKANLDVASCAVLHQ